MSRDGQAKSQSPELAGGAGFTFEGAIGAYYLVALLREAYGPGTDNRIVTRVAFQQRDLGEPLDDVIVDSRGSDGQEARLSLQAKSDLIISASASNKDFRDIIRDSWLTYTKPGFRKTIDRYGAAVGNIAKEKARTTKTLCELARESDTADHFEMRFAAGGNASEEQKTVKEDIISLLAEIKGEQPSSEEVHGFLSHFVLIEFDFMHPGAKDLADAMTRVRECLQPDQAGQAPILWGKFCHTARESAGRAGAYNRPRLLREIAPIARVRGVISMRPDIDKITALTKAWVADIQNEVGGAYLERSTLVDLLAEATSHHRFVQIVGLAGNGKSVLLRQRVEVGLAKGPVLFLKSDRLEGKGWSSFASANGLSDLPLESLLAEIGAVGSDTIYIDGIDRVEKDQKPIILDLLRTIVRTPTLSNWKIVVSVRDSGIEHLRNWLSDILNTVSIGTVEVSALDETEAELLAKEKPVLAPLLFGPPQVSEVVRRPFFAKILCQNFKFDGGKPIFEPKSEIDLINNWWERGGYNASGQEAIERQRAILDLASVRARQLGSPIPFAKLRGETNLQIHKLAEDGIIQIDAQGHTLNFSHDIFFEWSFFHLLIEYGDQWLEEIRACGEPPAVARVVELLSQWQFSTGKQWAATLDLIMAAKVRSQWARAWLLGPLGSSGFKANKEVFARAVFANGAAFLKKALVWFQAEKTTPNKDVLEGELPVEQRIRIADFVGWPSDFAAWRRFIEFLLANVDGIPTPLYPEILSIFDVWQNALSGRRNAVSLAALNKCADWLREIDAHQARMIERISSKNGQSTRWQGFRDLGNFRSSLSNLILRSAISVPELTEEYLKRVIASEDIRREQYREIITFSPTLSVTHPDLLVELTLNHLKDELPDDRVKRLRQEEKRESEWRKRILAKPESQRTDDEQKMLRFGGAGLHYFQPISNYDWETLCIDRESQLYWPPSPLREPFHSLFKTAPDKALELFRGLCNHATTAWRQLHQHDHRNGGTPISLELQFPWGKQEFWGGDKEYLWHRGMWAPHALASGFHSLEEWCFSELERGRPPDELIQKIVEGNESIGILGAAATIILQMDLVSETAFPIIMARRLWQVDFGRMVHDTSGGATFLIGFRSGDEKHSAAVTKAAERSCRRKTLRWSVSMYVFSSDFGDRTKQAALTFKDNLPYHYEEHRNIPEVREQLLKKANEDAEIALPENYRAQKSLKHEGMIEITHVSPSASNPENVEKLAHATRTLQQGRLWTWAVRCFDNGKLQETLPLADAIAQAKALDDPALFKPRNEEDLEVRRGAVTAVAAVVLRFREDRPKDELEWARSVIGRAYSAPEVVDETRFSRSSIPWHPSIFVARGLGADVRYKTFHEDTQDQLLALMTHPLEVVSLEAMAEAMRAWDVDAKLGWAALLLALDLCRIDPLPRDVARRLNDSRHSVERRRTALSFVIKYYKTGTGWPSLPLPPVAWIKRNAHSASKITNCNIVTPDVEFREEDLEDKQESWGEPETYWDGDYAAQLLTRIPFEKLLSSGSREEMLTFISSVFKWTNDKNSPPWLKKGRRDRKSTNLFMWTHQLASAMGDIAGYMTIDEVKTRFLEPMFGLEGDTCWAVLAGFTDRFICRYIYDAPEMPTHAIRVIDLCLERFLQSPVFNRKHYNAGEFYGWDEPRLVQDFMFVFPHGDCSGAARYANGDWKEIGAILPVIDRYVRAGGWIASVMTQFLTLCERSKDFYPAETFADQVLAVVGDGTQPLPGWAGTFIPARIAILVQFFAERQAPLPAVLGQKLLRVLDLLVDMGDRRSAALQLSETFREVKIG